MNPVYLGAIVGFSFAVAILYPDLREWRRRAKMFEEMNKRHNERLLACQSGAFRIIIKPVEQKQDH